ncbi:MAG: DUF975 family protein [Oscillospiraceae bacterium]|jgi:uncharacterized membrane protein|nr:DUF975 family protein [Oscillospiraceae bacterium]
MNNKEIREKVKEALAENSKFANRLGFFYWCICFPFYLLGMVLPALSVLFSVFSTIGSTALQESAMLFYRQRKAEVLQSFLSTLSKLFFKLVILMLVKCFICLAWGAIFLVPAIAVLLLKLFPSAVLTYSIAAALTVIALIVMSIKSLSLSFSEFVLFDNPAFSVYEAVKKSQKMTKGYRARVLLMSLHFVPLVAISFLCFGLPFIKIAPRFLVSNAGLYEEVKKRNGRN